MKQNVKVAKQLVKLAKNLIAAHYDDDIDMREDDYSYDLQKELWESGYYDPSFTIGV